MRAVRDVSQVSLRDATVLRCAGGLIFCGTIRSLALLDEAPWRYQARCPVKSSGELALAMPQDGVRTFLPLLRLAAQQPAITRPAR